MERTEWESRLRKLELFMQGAILEFQDQTGIRVDDVHVIRTTSLSETSVEISVDL